MKMRVLLTVCVSSLLICSALSASTGVPVTSQSTTKTPTTKPSTTPQSTAKPTTTPTKKSSTGPTTHTVPVTTLSPKAECQKNNGSCKDCLNVGSGQCVWCSCKNTCTLKEKLVPIHECDCSLSETKWGVCWVNYEALIIACGVIGGLLIVGLTVCICCCCCCKGNNKAKYTREDAKTERKKADLKVKHDERRADRKAKTDEIRRKYGLIKDDNAYQRFDEA